MAQTWTGGPTLVHSGKVRDTFEIDSLLLIVASDRVSAFDVVLQDTVPHKGQILNQMSNFWFDKLASLCENHLVETKDAELSRRVPCWHNGLVGRSVLAKRAMPLPIECVVRGYISGSLFSEYKVLGQTVHGLGLPAGLREGDRLPEPVFSPATKAQSGHDRNVSFDEACELAGGEWAEQAREQSLKIYRAAASHAATCGLILADTKFEFGVYENRLIWIDEALTPDSSRYWEASEWQPGHAQPSFDKQYLRDYLNASGWDKSEPGPNLPEAVIGQTLGKYREAFRRLVGREFSPTP